MKTNEPKISYRLVDNERDTLFALAELCDYNEIGLDMEMADWKLGEKHERPSILQLAVKIGKEYYVWIFDLFAVDIRLLKDLLEDRDTLYAIHNGLAYDARKLRLHFQIDLYNIWDTLLAERAKRGGRKGNSLGEVAARHLGWELDKSHQEDDWSRRPLALSMLQYAARDAVAHLLLYDYQRANGYDGEVTKRQERNSHDLLLPGLQALEELPRKRFWLEQFIKSGAARRFNKEWCSDSGIHILPGETEIYAAHLLRWLEAISKDDPKRLLLSYDTCGGNWQSGDHHCFQALEKLIELVDKGIEPNPAALEAARARAYRERAAVMAGYYEYAFEQACKYHALGHFPPPPKRTHAEINEQSWIDLIPSLIEDYKGLHKRLMQYKMEKEMRHEVK